MNPKTNKISASVTTSEIAPLNIMDCLFSGSLPASRAHSPNKAARLKMLDPMMMPTPTSCCLTNKAVTADEISGVAEPSAASMPSSPPDTLKRNLSVSRLAPRTKLDIVIKTTHRTKMYAADEAVINVPCTVSIFGTGSSIGSCRVPVPIRQAIPFRCHPALCAFPSLLTQT